MTSSGASHKSQSLSSDGTNGGVAAKSAAISGTTVTAQFCSMLASRATM